PLYLYGSQYPGGRIINCHAFLKDPICDINDPINTLPPGVDGNTPRNFARGFDAVQVDLALRREFPIRDRVHLQFRAEAFNLLNHPIFGSIYNQLSYGQTQFGYAYQTANVSLGNLSSLYQVGGPRSLQLTLRAVF